MKRGTRPSCDDVLEAFGCEPETGKATLEKYLRDFPEYAEAILDNTLSLVATLTTTADLVRLWKQ